jgi:ATP-dependent protease ClpP protease subunit
MSKRNMPMAELGAKPGVRSDISQQALARWTPELRAESTDAATISILDVIGQDFWGDGVTAKRVAGALRAIGSKPVTVTINSPGGDVFEGLAIYNQLREHPAEVTVKVIGLAASAASFIAMAGDKIEIAKSGFFMIHNSWVVAMGDRNALRDVADWLEPFDSSMAEIYADRSGQSVTELTSMMDKETWIGGKAAVDMGFADDFLPRDQVGMDAGGGEPDALRAERMFDVMASRAGVTKSAGRDLLASLKGGKSGAAPTGMSGAAEIEAGVADLLAQTKSLME